jgi:hypothetical protein
MNQKRSAGLCQETSGFLFRHPCDDIATQQCEICSRQICVGHSTFHDGVTCCVSCRKQRMSARRPDSDQMSAGTSNSAARPVPTDSRDAGGTSTSPGNAPWSRSRPFDSYDPYFYGYWHYPGYYSYQNRSHTDAGDGSSHDADDFTEADSESLIHPGDEMYEQDMSES